MTDDRCRSAHASSSCTDGIVRRDKMTPDRSRIAIESFLLWICLLVLLFVGSLRIGVTWDESIYFPFSDSIGQWLSAERRFDPDTIQRHWNENPYLNPHPPFMKILDAVTARLFDEVFLFPLNYRLGHFVYVSACLALAYALLRTAWPLLWALVAIFFVVLQPRIFAELLIATTDAPTAAAWLVLPLVAWRLDSSAPGKPLA
ncbi:MAG: hypothetical protein ACREQ9_11965, partial [Candidatus Binatia bacterium]